MQEAESARPETKAPFLINSAERCSDGRRGGWDFSRGFRWRGRGRDSRKHQPEFDLAQARRIYSEVGLDKDIAGTHVTSPFHLFCVETLLPRLNRAWSDFHAAMKRKYEHALARPGVAIPYDPPHQILNKPGPSVDVRFED